MKCQEKVSFNTKEEADQRIKEINNSGETRRRKPSRSYECPICRKYHLTGIDQKQQSRIIQLYKDKHTKFIKRESSLVERKFGEVKSFEKIKKKNKFRDE